MRDAVPKVPVELWLASFNLRTGSLFPRRFVEGDQSSIRFVKRSSAFSYGLVIWLLVEG